jgi:hypothetical protein
MADFHISGRIEPLAPGRYSARVVAVPAGSAAGIEPAREMEQSSGTWQDASAQLKRLTISMGVRLRAEGHGVLNVDVQEAQA